MHPGSHWDTRGTMLTLQEDCPAGAPRWRWAASKGAAAGGEAPRAATQAAACPRPGSLRQGRGLLWTIHARSPLLAHHQSRGGAHDSLTWPQSAPHLPSGGWATKAEWGSERQCRGSSIIIRVSGHVSRRKPAEQVARGEISARRS